MKNTLAWMLEKLAGDHLVASDVVMDPTDRIFHDGMYYCPYLPLPSDYEPGPITKFFDAVYSVLMLGILMANAFVWTYIWIAGIGNG